MLKIHNIVAAQHQIAHRFNTWRHTGCAMENIFVIAVSRINRLWWLTKQLLHIAKCLYYYETSWTEAYPGDISYYIPAVRACCQIKCQFWRREFTALPIVETQAGDVSGYIPTNIISITMDKYSLKKIYSTKVLDRSECWLICESCGIRSKLSLWSVCWLIKTRIALYREVAIFYSQFDADMMRVQSIA